MLCVIVTMSSQTLRLVNLYRHHNNLICLDDTVTDLTSQHKSVMVGVDARGISFVKRNIDATTY